MNEDINLCELLNDCPKGTEFWHSIHGKVNLVSIDNDVTFPIYLKLYGNNVETCRLAKDGHFLEGVGDCLLWPSKESRDWSKWKYRKKSKYRPFRTQEECWNEMYKHPNFGWVKEKKSEMIYNISGISKLSIVILEDISSFKEAFNIYQFEDGSPFGIKED